MLMLLAAGDGLIAAGVEVCDAAGDGLIGACEICNATGDG
jgi:hypothetical protein